MTIPNLITILRFCLVPGIIGAIASDAWRLAFWLFLVAGVSDFVDGYVAKRFEQATPLGAILDPLADKVLLVSLFVTLAILGPLPVWLVIIVVFRDLMIIIAVMTSWLVGNPLKIAASRLSKLNTAAQIALAQLVLTSRAFEIPLPRAVLACSIVVATLTLGSAAAYLRIWLRHIAGSGTGQR
jgi:cardiolipin synthase